MVNESEEDNFFNEIIEYVKKQNPVKKELMKEKVRLCSKHGLKRIPTDIEIFLQAKEQDVKLLKKYLQTKPTRTISGVCVIAVMTKPFPCPHGKCAMCPGGLQSFFGDVPQSYTGKEPATLRAIRNHYDAYLQVFNRLEQYIVLGQSPEKVELIIMGGTFPSFPKEYREEFVRDAFMAMNDFSNLFYDKQGNFDIEKFKAFFELPGEIGRKERVENIQKKLLALKRKRLVEIYKKSKARSALEKEQKRNETSKIRCVGLTIETRPDYAKLEHANEMLRLGCTRVELGVQSVYDEALKRIYRGHDVAASIEATKILKDLGFKINYHMMLGLPGVDFLQEIQGLKMLFSDSRFRPDMLKLYPCMVLRGTKLYDEWKQGFYKPLTTEQATRLIIEFKRHVPEYVRIMRVQRDIPTVQTEAGVDRTNLRQIISERMRSEKAQCRCIRCREIKGDEIKGKVELKVKEYSASGGIEYFISLENNDKLIGFCRLRFPSQTLRAEITGKSALIRELHVYGVSTPINIKGEVQHKGFGRRLLQEAEKIARKAGKEKIVIISGIGVREYYRKQRYRREGPYMVKKIV